MIKVKDFNVGDKVYILRNQNLREGIVTKRGRLYVTVDDYDCFECINGHEFALVSHACERSDLLFKTKQDYESHIEREALLRWFTHIASREFSLEQLRAIKAIVGD